MLLLLAIQIPVKASHIMSLFSDHSDGEDTAPTLTLSQTPVSCYGRTDGSITAQASGGIAPYQFSKDNGKTWQNDRYFERLSAGRYTIIVKDNEGLRGSASITVSTPSALSAVAKPYPASCHDSENGSIIITASGGTAPYQYFMDEGPNWQYDAQFKEVHTGSHIIYVRDRQECMIQLMADITAPPPLTVSAKHDNVTCNEGKDGRITVEAAGGTPPYQYSEDKGSSWQQAPTFTQLAQGEHEILVRDRNGCVAGTTVDITAPLALNVSTSTTDVSCYGACNGRIVIKATGGVAPYKYSNNQGLTWQQTPDFPGISAGVYQLVVKDSNGCMIRKPVKLSEPTSLSMVSSSATFASATDCSLTMAAGGGIPAYSFSIDRGQTWQDSATFAHIRTGAHSVLIKDDNGCSRGLTVTLANRPLQLVVDSWGASCFGAANARIVVKVQDGTPPYRYSIDNGASWRSQNTINTRAGAYTILVEDQSGKRGSVNVQVGEPTLLTASVEITDVSCHNAANGIITPIVAGGVPPYKYSLNKGETWQSSANFEGLSGGNYILLIKDSYECGTSLSATIQEPAALSTRVQSNSTSCYGKSDGGFQAITSGGTPPYQYSLDGGQHWQDTASFTGLAAGKYRLLIRDAKGCTDNATIQVKAPQPVTFTAGTKQVSCNGGADGSITIAAQGGTAPYRYSMDHAHWQEETLFDNLRAGNFTLVVEDTKGCTKQANVVVTEPAILQLALESAANGCSYSGGQIQVKANGGTFPYLYTTADSINSTDGRFSKLQTGSYAVMVKDKNGCVDSLEPVSITVSPPLYLNMAAKTDMQCDGIHKGSVTLTASGGISPYKYELNGSAISSMNIPSLDNGVYEAVVKDQNGCIATQQFDIILRNEQCELTMPSGFSPNGDGRNDIFRPALYGNISQYKLEVFNAWGNLVFASNDPETGWDGAFKGKQQAGGTYVWMARYTDYKGIAKVRRGVVTLLR
jgi:gliding motility-associated-like protein